MTELLPQSRPYQIADEDSRQRVIKFISMLSLQKIWKVTVTPWRQKRSLNQNSLYWMWLREIANETGNDIDDLHVFFRMKYLPPDVVRIGGVETSVPMSSTKLSKVDMKQYLNDIEAFAATELGIMLTIPSS